MTTQLMLGALNEIEEVEHGPLACRALLRALTPFRSTNLLMVSIRASNWINRHKLVRLQHLMDLDERQLCVLAGAHRKTWGEVADAMEFQFGIQLPTFRQTIKRGNAWVYEAEKRVRH